MDMRGSSQSQRIFYFSKLSLPLYEGLFAFMHSLETNNKGSKNMMQTMTDLKEVMTVNK